jgi:signal transduction histidine kinase
MFEHFYSSIFLNRIMAKYSSDQFAALYHLALSEYLKGDGESALDRGYELGREAAVNGVGVLEAVEIYKRALEKNLLSRQKPLERSRVIRAMEFFLESLSPFEVMHRGYRENNARLRLLSERLQTVRDEERANIARDIHDDLGRSLTCLKYDLSALQNRFRGQKVKKSTINPKASKNPETKTIFVLNKTESMLKSIDQTIQTVRKIASALRPSVLDDLGLEAAIEWQLREFRKTTGIQFKLSLPSCLVVVDPMKSSSIFRIFQEILTNTARHARATAVRISLRKNGGELVLEVQDNGIGIEPAALSSTGSLGLLGMRERASYLGGVVRIAGRPGKGTRVIIQIPLVTETR